MTSKERVKQSLAHKTPDKIPLDFGGTTVTGMHVSCVSALREYYGLDRHPVKVYEPYQMLGLIEDDLKEAIGIDVEGVGGRKNMFGILNADWKEWRLDNGLDVLIPGGFNTTVDEKGNRYVYPCGDLSVPPSGKMPKNGFYFDALVRQEPFDDVEDLDPNDNLEEFSYRSDEEIASFAEDLKAASEKAGRFRSASEGLLSEISLSSRALILSTPRACAIPRNGIWRQPPRAISSNTFLKSKPILLLLILKS